MAQARAHEEELQRRQQHVLALEGEIKRQRDELNKVVVSVVAVVVTTTTCPCPGPGSRPRPRPCAPDPAPHTNYSDDIDQKK